MKTGLLEEFFNVSKEDKFFTQKQIDEFTSHPVWEEIIETLKSRLVSTLKDIAQERSIDLIRYKQGTIKEIEYFLEMPNLLSEDTDKLIIKKENKNE
jgi:hypothetical protein